MSLLIKGMKVPESCSACKFKTNYTKGFLDPFTDWCYLTNAKLGRYDNDEAEWKKGRKEWCPLVEVSERNTDIKEFQQLILNVGREHAEKGEDIETLGSLCADLIIGIYGLVEKVEK